MFTFEKINYTTDAFHAVIAPAISDVGLSTQGIKVIIVDNYTNRILRDEIVYCSLSKVISFIENY